MVFVYRPAVISKQYTLSEIVISLQEHGAKFDLKMDLFGEPDVLERSGLVFSLTPDGLVPLRVGDLSVLIG